MEKKKRKWMKKSLLKTYNFSHDNFLREMEISLLLDYKVYLQMFFSFFGKLMDMITSLIQKNDMIMINCCAPPEARLYNVNIFVQPLLRKLFDGA
jgi:hypothetical protein